MTHLSTYRLEGLHALLEGALAQERARSRPDDRTLAIVRKRKLAIKNRLTRLQPAG